MARHGLFVNKQSGGMFSIEDMTRSTGNHFYVDSGRSAASDDPGAGTNPDIPFATIDYAVGRCSASNGDIIYVMPGHAETVTAAGGLDLDVAGINVIGLGDGADQPTVTLTTIISADVDVDAANITVQNIHFVAGFADIDAAIDVNADNFTLDSCRMTGDNAGLNAKI